MLLITCNHCRQQLQVPEGNLGKSVPCPHCQSIIVALPSMELDQPAPPVTNVSASYPPEPVTPATKDPLGIEELPPLPSIERRAPAMRPEAGPERTERRWIIGMAACLLFSVIVMGFKDWIGSSQKRDDLPVFVKVEPMPANPWQFVPANPELKKKPTLLGFLPWQEYVNAAHRFRVELPCLPAEEMHKIQLHPMAVFTARQDGFEFAVAHRMLSEKEYRAVPPADQFGNLERFWCAQMNVVPAAAENQPLRDGRTGRDWTFMHNNRIILHARALYVRDGDVHHEYLLTVKVPAEANPFDEVRVPILFMASFKMLPASADNARVGLTVVEDISEGHQPGGLENEFTALALHPTRPVAVVGTHRSEIKVVWLNGEKETRVIARHELEIEPIEQLGFSSNGRWLAVAVGGKIQIWQDWDEAVPQKKWLIPGDRFVFTPEHRLLIAHRDGILEYDPDKPLLTTVLQGPDKKLQRLVLSPDGRLLAGAAGSEIFLWPLAGGAGDGKMSGKASRIAAQAGPISALAFAPDGQTLASAGADRSIKLWDVPTRQLRATLRQHAWPAWNLAFADNGRHLLSAGLDGMLLLWDLQPDQPRLAWAQAHQFPARAVAWDEPGRQIYFTCKQPAGANQDAFSLQLRKIAWVNILPDPAEAEKIIARRAGLHIPSPDAVCLVTPDGKTMVTTSPSRKPGSKAQVIRLWDAASGRSRFAVPARKGIALSPDGKWLVFVRPGPRPQIGLIEVRANLVHADRAPLETDTLPPVLFTPDGQSMWVLLKNELVLYQLPALTPGRRLQLQAPADDSTLNLIPAQDGQTFLVDRNSPRTGMRQRTLHALADGKELPWPNLPRDGEPPPFLRLRHKSEKIELEDIVQGTRVTIGRQRHVPQASALHPGRKLAVTVDATDDRGLLIHFWNFEERRLLLTLPDLASGAAGLRFSADGNLFCCITSAGWTRIVPTDWLLERKALLSSLPATAPGPE